VDLIRRYCNRPDLQERLAKARARASQPGRPVADSTIAAMGRLVSRPWKVADRLTEADIEQLIAEFLAGTPKWRLAEHYVISIGTVKNILRKHGVRRPN
jgi:hypothetical protein